MKKYIYLLITILIASGCEGDSSEISAGDGISQGGSLARFAISKNHLYVVNKFSLIPIDITNINEADTKDKVDLGFGIETLFPTQDNLFVGSRDAVYILSIEDPDLPELISIYQHSSGCDPVVVNGSFAYVTIKDGFSCNNPEQLNALQVLDLSDLSDPKLIAVVNMTSPGGLGIGCNQKLYVCEGQFGLVQFDISDPTSPKKEEVFPEIYANDIIIRDNLMIVTGKDGIYQFDCSSGSPVLLSTLEIAL